jgi:hypothetical protein
MSPLFSAWRAAVSLWIAATIASACVDSRPRPPLPSEGEQIRTADTYFACLDRVARQLDDRRADAATVGELIAPLCSSEYARFAQIYERRLDDDRKVQIFRERIFRDQIRYATQVVISVRAEGE